jgi:hypothetical protein
MANYSINANLPGVKKVFSSEPAATVGSSTVVPMLVVALDPDNAQSTDGYIACNSNTSTTTVKFNVTNAIAADEWVGLYCYVSGVDEVRTIIRNTAADAAAETTITVSKPFTTAPSTGHQAVVRRWEGWNLPSLHSSLQGFAEKYIAKNTNGTYNWTGQAAAYYTINEAKKAGVSLFYVLPVSAGSSATELANNLDPTANSTFTTRMLQLSPQPDLICCPKQPTHTETLSAAQWAVIDGSWVTYITNRATDDAVDDNLREMFYIADSHTAVNATSITYRTSDWNPTSERCGLWHGHYLVADVLTKGSITQASLGPAICGVINRISTGVPESYGHAFEGRNFSQVAHLGLVEDLTPANRLSLISQGINPIIAKPGQGSWLESQTTMAKSSTDTGSDPFEHLHVIIGRGKIWNQLQPILESVLAEPNTVVVRQGLLSRIDSVMTSLLAQGIIAAYQLSDVTEDIDVTSGTARFELRVVFNREIDFVELKLTAAIGQGE